MAAASIVGIAGSLVLRGARGARIVVVPRLGGRVLRAVLPDGFEAGWVDEAAARRERNPNERFHNVGGLDRLWIGPEGAPSASSSTRGRRPWASAGGCRLRSTGSGCASSAAARGASRSRGGHTSWAGAARAFRWESGERSPRCRNPNFPRGWGGCRRGRGRGCDHQEYDHQPRRARLAGHRGNPTDLDPGAVPAGARARVLVPLARAAAPVEDGYFGPPAPAASAAPAERWCSPPTAAASRKLGSARAPRPAAPAPTTPRARSSRSSASRSDAAGAMPTFSGRPRRAPMGATRSNPTNSGDGSFFELESVSPPARSAPARARSTGTKRCSSAARAPRSRP